MPRHNIEAIYGGIPRSGETDYICALNSSKFYGTKKIAD
jgi:hypothetical protein